MKSTAVVICAAGCGTSLAVDPRHVDNLTAAGWTCPACTHTATTETTT